MTRELHYVERRCACGGWVTARPSYPYHGVRRHQQTILHRLWWQIYQQMDRWERHLFLERHAAVQA